VNPEEEDRPYTFVLKDFQGNKRGQEGGEIDTRHLGGRKSKMESLGKNVQ